MKRQDFLNVGIREDCVEDAIQCVKIAAKEGRFHGVKPRKLVKDIAREPAAFLDDPHFGNLAKKISIQPEIQTKEPISYNRWGSDIEQSAIAQMEVACQLPVAHSAALMPDAHTGYGLSIGGVLACEDAVIPYAVGVDIACRMKLSVIDIPVETLEKELRSGMRRGDRLSEALENGTQFGIGSRWANRKEHPVLDMDWNVCGVTKALKDRAWEQLGTSGSGNHFVEIGTLDIPQDVMFPLSDQDGNLSEYMEIPTMKKGRYLAILSHSGSRGTGAAVCKEYNGIAKARLDKRYQEKFGNLAWLSIDSEAGQEYWAAMSLMGEYAKANHAVIHRTVAQLLGATIIAGVENHHNFAWQEFINGKELFVHRKGATPAHLGELGVIPGNMADSCYVVRGKGNAKSLMSSSHGAGRRMSRTEAKKRFNWKEWKDVLKQRNVRLLSAGLDEVPGAYKDIKKIIKEQADLVDVIGEFMPRIVKMSDDGRSED